MIDCIEGNVVALQQKRLLIVVPARNEEKTLPLVLRYIALNIDGLKGDLRVKLVLVDDASTDDTPNIMKAFISRHSFASYIRLSHDKSYDSSIGLVRAVKAGILHAEKTGFDWDIFMQVDSDTVLIPPYIKLVTNVMIKNPRIGISGGVTVNEKQGRLHIRNTGIAIKRGVWRDCNGYKPVPSPDTVIQVCAIKKGWKLAKVSNAKMVVLRPTNLNYYRTGFTEGLLGLSPFFALVRNANLLLAKKNIGPPVYFTAGYISGILNKDKYRQLADLKDARRLIEKAKILASIRRISI